ncbi:hypothetical protein GGQ85_002690 [Nitrobacter vulgaris]|nr:hypothetical protein [Nitrobacter vulgaris]
MQHAAWMGFRQSWIVFPAASAAFVCGHLRRDHDKSLCIEYCYTIGDGGHMPIDEGDQTSGYNGHLFARWSFPNNLPV